MTLIIFAGGPGSGKSSTVRLVADMFRRNGYSVYIIRDWAREIIREEKNKTNPILPWTNRLEFERRVILSYLRDYRSLFDHGREKMFDVILEDGGGYSAKAYCMVDNVALPSEYYELLKYIDKVSLVFFMEFPEKYVTDSERWENQEYACKIHNAIKELYEELFSDKIVFMKYTRNIYEKALKIYNILTKKFFV